MGRRDIRILRAASRVGEERMHASEDGSSRSCFQPGAKRLLNAYSCGQDVCQFAVRTSIIEA